MWHAHDRVVATRHHTDTYIVRSSQLEQALNCSACLSQKSEAICAHLEKKRRFMSDCLVLVVFFNEFCYVSTKVNEPAHTSSFLDFVLARKGFVTPLVTCRLVVAFLQRKLLILIWFSLLWVCFFFYFYLIFIISVFCHGFGGFRVVPARFRQVPVRFRVVPGSSDRLR